MNGSEKLHDCFVSVNTHKEVIELALYEFSGGIGVLNSFELVREAIFLEKGQCWIHLYSCNIEDNRAIYAALYTQYKEK